MREKWWTRRGSNPLIKVVERPGVEPGSAACKATSFPLAYRPSVSGLAAVVPVGGILSTRLAPTPPPVLGTGAMLHLSSKPRAPRKCCVRRGAEEPRLPLLVLGANVSRCARKRDAAVCAGKFEVLLCQEMMKACVFPTGEQFEVLETVVRAHIVFVVYHEASGDESTRVLPVHEVVFENPTARLVARAGILRRSTDEAVGRSHARTYPCLRALQRSVLPVA